MRNGNHNHNDNHRRNGRPVPYRYLHLSIYKWIVKYASQHHGVSPTFQEIMTEFYIPSKSTVFHILAALERGGLIERPRDCKRSIVIVGAQWTPPVKV